jgi:hypothetical protein
MIEVRVVPGTIGVPAVDGNYGKKTTLCLEMTLRRRVVDFLLLWAVHQ